MISVNYKVLTIENGRALIKDISEECNTHHNLEGIANEIDQYITLENLKPRTVRFGGQSGEVLYFKNPEQLIPRISNGKFKDFKIQFDLTFKDKTLVTNELTNDKGQIQLFSNPKDYSPIQWDYLYREFVAKYKDFLMSYERENTNLIIEEYLKEKRAAFKTRARFSVYDIGGSESSLILDISHYEGFHSHTFYKNELVSVDRNSNIGFGSWSYDVLLISVDGEKLKINYSHQRAIEELNKLMNATKEQLLEYKKEIIRSNIRVEKEQLAEAESYSGIFQEKREFSPEERLAEFTHQLVYFSEYDYSDKPMEALLDYIAKKKDIVNNLIDRHTNCTLGDEEKLLAKV